MKLQHILTEQEQVSLEQFVKLIQTSTPSYNNEVDHVSDDGQVIGDLSVTIKNQGFAITVTKEYTHGYNSPQRAEFSDVPDPIKVKQLDYAIVDKKNGNVLSDKDLDYIVKKYIPEKFFKIPV